jgi:hypothetical protein
MTIYLKPDEIDLNGQELILDADRDTSITADTDDQIDIKIAGADDFQFTSNTFTVLAGSSIVIAGLMDLNGVADALVLDADGDTTISAPTDDQIDIEISGTDYWRLTATAMTMLADIDFVPATTNTGDIGTATYKWANVYATNVYAGELNLFSDVGHWVLQEAEDCIYAVNKLTGKRYQLVLQEV